MDYFIWNVDQEIIHFAGRFGLRWYSLFFLSGFLLGYHFLGKMLVHAKKPITLRDPFLYYMMFGTILGARLGHCLFYDPAYYFSDPIRILKVWEGGLASHGGFLGIIIGMFIFGKRYPQTPFLWMADRVCILAVLAGAFIRMGNFFNSEIIGRATDVPWAVVFLKVDPIPRHPTQLYEAIGYASVSAILYGIYRFFKRDPLEGRILGAALAIAYTFRFFIEFLKENQVSYEDGMFFNMGQMLSIPFVLIGLYFFLGFHHKFPGFAWALSPKPPVQVEKKGKKSKKKTARV